MYKIQDSYIPQFKIGDSYKTPAGVTIPTITGQTGQVDFLSQNGYYYQTDFWDTILADPVVQQQIEAHDMLNTVEHPKDDEKFLRTPYNEASHIILKAWVQNHNPFAIIGLLNNEQGNQIKALVDVGHRPGVSTRGMGEFGRDEKGQFVKKEDYIFLGWDLVRAPNFTKLKMDPVTDAIIQNSHFKELCDMHQIKDSAYTGYNRDSLIHDMGVLIKDLNEKYQSLLNLK